MFDIKNIVLYCFKCMEPSFGMSMRHEQTLGYEQSLRCELAYRIGDSAGEIPVYSLHKIRRLLVYDKPDLSDVAIKKFWLIVTDVNREYRQTIGKQWMCLTSNGLTESFELFFDWLVVSVVNPAVASLPDSKEAQESGRDYLMEKVEETIITLRNWFDANIAQLHYNMNGKIPWAVVCKLQAMLRKWTVRVKENPFDMDVAEFVLSVAREEGCEHSHELDAWEWMGGKPLFDVE